MPSRILRISTSNLAVWKRIFVEIGGMDESLPTGYDARFGQDVRNKGYSLLFNPGAIVYHHHRATFRAYFKQQFRYARYDVRLYTSGFATREDSVTTQAMFVDLVLCDGGLGVTLAAIVSLSIGAPTATISVIAGVLVGLLVASAFVRGIIVARRELDLAALLLYPAMLIIRVLAWTLGGLVGLLFLRRRLPGGISAIDKK